MTTWNWVALGMWGVAQLGLIFGVYVKARIDMTKLETEVAHCKEDFKLHEQQNERTFSSLETKI